MKKAFLKKFNFTNIIVVGGLTTYGALVFNKFRKKDTLNDPIIQEFLRIAENDKKIREIVGLPIFVNDGILSSLSISNNKDENFADINLPIRGKNGKFNVKIYGNSLKHKEIVNSEKKNYYQKEYYIPELKVLDKLKKFKKDKKNLEKEPLNDNDVFWRIEMLEIEKKKGITKNETYSIEVPEIISKINMNNFTRKNLNDLINYEKERKNYFSNLKFPDSHVDYTYKSKMQETMRKRYFVINTFAVCGFLTYFWFLTRGKASQFKNLAHSQVIKNSQVLVKNFLNKNGMRNINFNETVIGGKYLNLADFCIDFNGKNFYGKAFFKVSFDKNNFDFNEYKIEYFLRKKNGEEEFYSLKKPYN